MRTVIAFFVGIVTAAVVAGLVVLIMQDSESEQFTFLGVTLSGGKGAIVAGSVALGFGLAVLMLLPGRLASAWNQAYIHRQTRALEERLRVLQAEYARLHGWHQRLVEEHGLVLNRVLPTSQPPAPAGHMPRMAPLAAGAVPSNTPVVATPVAPAVLPTQALSQ